MNGDSLLINEITVISIKNLYNPSNFYKKWWLTWESSEGSGYNILKRY